MLPTQCLLQWLPALPEIHWLFLHPDLHTTGPQITRVTFFFLIPITSRTFSLNLPKILNYFHQTKPPCSTLQFSKDSLKIQNDGSQPLSLTLNLIFSNSDFHTDYISNTFTFWVPRSLGLQQSCLLPYFSNSFRCSYHEVISVSPLWSSQF